MPPLNEAKMIHQLDHHWATYDTNSGDSRDADINEKKDPSYESLPRYWIPQKEVNEQFEAKEWKHCWLLKWRDIHA